MRTTHLISAVVAAVAIGPVTSNADVGGLLPSSLSRRSESEALRVEWDKAFPAREAKELEDYRMNEFDDDDQLESDMCGAVCYIVHIESVAKPKYDGRLVNCLQDCTIVHNIAPRLTKKTQYHAQKEVNAGYSRCVHNKQGTKQECIEAWTKGGLKPKVEDTFHMRNAPPVDIKGGVGNIFRYLSGDSPGRAQGEDRQTIPFFGNPGGGAGRGRFRLPKGRP